MTCWPEQVYFPLLVPFPPRITFLPHFLFLVYLLCLLLPLHDPQNWELQYLFGMLSKQTIQVNKAATALLETTGEDGVVVGVDGS